MSKATTSRRIWALYHGNCYTDGGFSGIAFKTKKTAVAWIREQGFKYNKTEGIYINNEIDNYNGTFGQWYRIEDMEYYDE